MVLPPGALADRVLHVGPFSRWRLCLHISTGTYRASSVQLFFCWLSLRVRLDHASRSYANVRTATPYRNDISPNRSHVAVRIQPTELARPGPTTAVVGAPRVRLSPRWRPVTPCGPLITLHIWWPVLLIKANFSFVRLFAFHCFHSYL